MTALASCLLGIYFWFTTFPLLESNQSEKEHKNMKWWVYRREMERQRRKAKHSTYNLIRLKNAERCELWSHYSNHDGNAIGTAVSRRLQRPTFSNISDRSAHEWVYQIFRIYTQNIYTILHFISFLFCGCLCVGSSFLEYIELFQFQHINLYMHNTHRIGASSHT